MHRSRFETHVSFCRQQLHTTVALFDPEEYAEFCAEHGPRPRHRRQPHPLHRGTRRHAAPPSRTSGQPSPTSSPTSIDEAVRHATWEYATTLLADLGAAPTAARTSAAPPSTAPPEPADAHPRHGAGPGSHHLVCSVSATPDSTPRRPPRRRRHATGATRPRRGRRRLEFATVLAVGIALESPGGLVMRTSAPDAPDRLHGWRLHGDGLDPAHRGRGLRAPTAPTSTSGDLVSPESGVDYCAGFRPHEATTRTTHH